MNMEKNRIGSLIRNLVIRSIIRGGRVLLLKKKMMNGLNVFTRYGMIPFIRMRR